jgi:hypothetical protein
MRPNPVACCIAGLAFGRLLSCPLTAGALTAPDGPAFRLAGPDVAANLAVDPNDYPVVALAAGFLADDVQRVTGHRPKITGRADTPELIIAGTLGHSALIDELVRTGQLPEAEPIKGRWEATCSQLVEHPFPGVERAWVIAGSDRRGTAYGLMEISERIGVSPWSWWADVPTQRKDVLALAPGAPHLSAPAVRYRGIFINDEDWGLNPWAAQTFDPTLKNIGPKTYERVFELMLRLRLNYIWPAMHACTAEFGSIPENVRLADRYAIVAGSSHCEPMLFNNIHWDEQKRGAWNYLTNRDAVHRIWEETAANRGAEEAVWTLGIRGIHDAAMETPPTRMDERRKLLNGVIADQRALLDRHVTRAWGPVAQCFVPYKEVLPIYDAGLSVPDDVTIVWVDDNFGYIRRVGSPLERRRSGGQGLYWHLSYYGGPHSYTWINSTAPALIWEEFHKAWENDVRTIWVINVGDIKPMEIGIDYFARLAWDPESCPLGAQTSFLRAFVEKNLSPTPPGPVVDLLNEFYRLGTIHKPELMDREWALSLSDQRASQLALDYRRLLEREDAAARIVSPADRDAYEEMIGFPARVLGDTGLIFMADRAIQFGRDAAQNSSDLARYRAELERDVIRFNHQIAGGKWNRIMPGLETGPDRGPWSSQVRWPWDATTSAPSTHGELGSVRKDPPPGQAWRDAATFIGETQAGTARWSLVQGLGTSGRAMVLTPAALSSAWPVGSRIAPALTYDFATTTDAADLFVDFLPTYRSFPGQLLRVAVAVDGHPPTVLEVPGSNGLEDENASIRQYAVQDNYVRAHQKLTGLVPGKHTLTIQAIDPGIVLDRISLPAGGN